MNISVSQRYKNIFTPCLMAVALLTRLPVMRFLPKIWSDKALGQSALWYPFVGLLLGFLLACLILVLPPQTPSILVAVLVVTAWALLTGALHLDGLVDSVDAIYASHAVMAAGDATESAQLLGAEGCPKKQTLLRVLKDPNVGAVGVVALVLLLLLKVSVISASPQLLLSVLVAMVVSRSLALAFIVSTPYTPYASKAGLGAVLAARTPKVLSIAILAVVLLGLFMVLPISGVFILLAIQLVLLYCWRDYWLKQLDGFVGDSIGALIELSEVSVLLTLCFLFL